MPNYVSTYGLRLVNSNTLMNGQYTMGVLSQQLSTQKKATDLKDYSTSEAQQLMNFTNEITQREGFLSVYQALAARIEVYDSSLSGIEEVAATAASTITISSTYNSEQNATIEKQVKGYIQQISYYLNQKVGDRYIYSGTRYNVSPVKDIMELPLLHSYEAASVTVLENCATFTSKYSGTFGNGLSVEISAGTLPNTNKVTISVEGQEDEEFDNIAGTGSTFWSNLETAVNAGSRLVTVDALGGTRDPEYTTYVLEGGTGASMNGVASVSDASGAITFTALAVGTYGNNITVEIEDGTVPNTFTVTVNIPNQDSEVYADIDASGGGTAFWNNVADAINSTPSDIIMATVGNGSDLPAAGVTTTYSLSGGAQPEEEYPYVTANGVLPKYDADYDEVYDAASGLVNPNANRADAYYEDQVYIDTAQRLNYGITSNDAAFQKLIMGLRFAYAATQDIDNYSSNMSKAGDLIKEGLTEIRGIHSNLSSANNTLEQAKTMHSNYISTIKGEIDGIQGVDLNEIALKINLYQSTLTAAYAATAKITQISVLNYI